MAKENKTSYDTRYPISKNVAIREMRQEVKKDAQQHTIKQVTKLLYPLYENIVTNNSYICETNKYEL